jgi:hypothetical protein
MKMRLVITFQGKFFSLGKIRPFFASSPFPCLLSMKQTHAFKLNVASTSHDLIATSAEASSGF